MHHFPFHVGDYASHTRHLSLMEDLAYRRLLDLHYTSEQPLAGDAATLARLICMRDHVAEVDTVLNEFFALGQEGWSNARCTREIASYQAMVEGGRKGGLSRGQGGVTKPLKQPRTKNQEPRTKEPSALRARRCPDGWSPPQDALDAMTSECPGVDLARETAQFRDWEFKDPKTDWPAAWRRWIRKAATDLRDKPTGETNYARSIREKYEQVTPRIAAKAPGVVRENPMDVIEGMTREPLRIAS